MMSITPSLVVPRCDLKGPEMVMQSLSAATGATRGLALGLRGVAHGGVDRAPSRVERQAKEPPQLAPSQRLLRGRDLQRVTTGDDRAALVSAAWAQIQDVVGVRDELQV